MNPPTFSPQTRVAEVFEREPQSARLFIAHGTDCVGCVMAPFCTLHEMSLHYAVDLEEFLGELARLGAERA
jgi:hypothetical protein